MREKIQAAFVEHYTKALENTQPEKLIENAVNMLVRKRQEVANKLLGIDTRWGQVELESNGLLKKYVDSVMDTMMPDYIRDVIVPEVEKTLSTTAVRTAIAKQAKNSLEWKLGNLVSDAAQVHLKTMIAETLEELTK